MKLNRTGSIWDRNERININDNWDTIEEFISTKGESFLNAETYKEWLTENSFKVKDPVNTVSDLPIDAEKRELRAVMEDNSFYLFDGENWIKQIAINLDALSPIKTTVDTLENELEVVNQEVVNVDRKSESASNTQKSRVIYRSAHSIRVIGTSYQMLGFRFLGQYHKVNAPYFYVEKMNNIVNINQSLGVEANLSFNNWYAIFACANNGDEQSTFKVMPYFRVKSIANDVITFGDGGENSDVQNIRSYSVSQDSLVDCDALVVNESIDQRPNAFSGRITKILSNSNTTIKLEDSGFIGEGDYILVAPPGFEHYRYLSSFYVDSAEIRNFADGGDKIGTRGASIKVSETDGDISSGVYLSLAGHISPLATGAIIQIRQILSTSSTGTANLKIGMDASHDYSDLFSRKNSTTTETLISSNIPLYFGYRGQKFHMSSNGTLHSSATRQIDIRGYSES